MKTFPASLSLKLHKSKDLAEEPSNLKIITLGDFEAEKTGDIFYLNPYTFENLFEKMVVENERMKSMPGWLYTEKPGKTKTLVVTEDISESQLKRLYSAMSTIDKEIHLLALNSITGPIENLEVISQTEFKKPGAVIITTEDPHFIANILKEEKDQKPILHGLDIRTHASDLIDLVELKETSEGLSFIHRAQDIAKALISGKTVILHGTLSEEMYRS